MSGSCTNCGNEIGDVGVLSPTIDPTKREMCLKCARMIVGETDAEILFYAFRYALGRMTYVSSVVSDYIIKHWDLITRHTQDMIKMEIKAAIRMGTAGMEMDVKLWQRILAL